MSPQGSEERDARALSGRRLPGEATGWRQKPARKGARRSGPRGWGRSPQHPLPAPGHPASAPTPAGQCCPQAGRAESGRAGIDRLPDKSIDLCVEKLIDLLLAPWTRERPAGELGTRPSQEAAHPESPRIPGTRGATKQVPAPDAAPAFFAARTRLSQAGERGRAGEVGPRMRGPAAVLSSGDPADGSAVPEAGTETDQANRAA